jgi:predicted Zn finger-like uncharacterized protein
MFVFKCPECDAELKSNNRPPEGKKIRCKQCQSTFVPKVKEVKDDPVPAAAATAAKGGDDEDGPVNPYGVVQEEDTEAQKEAKKKVRFDGVDDKKKRSARGPAMSLLVMPANLLIAEGGLTFVVGLATMIYGAWPLIFTDISPSDDDYADQIPVMLFGVIIAVWGAMICLGASRMQNLESYTWAMTGAVLGILPLLVGVFALIMLRNPKVIAGFQEVEGAMDADDTKEDDDEDEDEEDEDDEDEDD